MDPQNWSGFDRRNVCPRCGGYPAHFGRQEVAKTTRRPLDALRLLAVLILALQIGIVFLLVGEKPTLDPVTGFGLLVTVALVVGMLFAYRAARRGPSAPGPGSAAIIYSLQCGQCGYRWQKTAQEWEREGQRDGEDLLGYPPVAGQAQEDLGKIDAVPPDQVRTILITTGVVIVLLLVSAVRLGMLLQRSQLGPAGAFAILNGGVLVLLLILIVGGVIAKAKPARLIPVVVLFLCALALWLLIR